MKLEWLLIQKLFEPGNLKSETKSFQNLQTYLPNSKCTTATKLRKLQVGQLSKNFHTYIPNPSSFGSVSTIQGGLYKEGKVSMHQTGVRKTQDDYFLDQNLYLFIIKFIVPSAARWRRTSLASIAIPSGYMENLKDFIILIWHLSL